MNRTDSHDGMRDHRVAGRETAFPAAGGFTLMEVLIAVFLFSLVMSVLYGTFNAVVGGAGAVDRDLHLSEAARICLDRLVTDLRSVHVAAPPFYTKPDMTGDPDPYRFQGEAEGVGGERFPVLRFASRAVLPITPGPNAGIVELNYYVDADEETGFVLKRSERHYPYPPHERKVEDPVLCERVRSLTFTFIDDMDEPREEWDSESRMTDYATPRCVVINLELGDADRSEWFRTAVRLPVHRKALD